MEHGKRRASLLPLGLVLAALVIVVAGGTIRILDAGESCPDWPTCFGTWGFSVDDDEQAAWWAANPNAGEDTRGADHRYSELEIFSEWVHRLLVGIVALPVAVNALLMHAWRDRYGQRVRNVAVLAGVLLVLQATAGALTVVFDNRDWTVAMHLGLATVWIATLIHQWLLMRVVEGASWPILSLHAAHRAAHGRRIDAAAGAVLLLLLLGAWVSSTAPGAQYNQACSVGFPEGWPACRGQLLPDADGPGVIVQMIHRIGALLVGVILILGGSRLRAAAIGDGVEPSLARAMDVTAGFWLANLLVGGGYIVFADADGFPEGLSLLHLVLGVASALVILSAALLLRVPDDLRGGAEE